MSTLARIWSLDTSDSYHVAHPTAPNPDPSTFGLWIVNITICTRELAHLMALELDIVPSTETRLINEGLIPLYQAFRNLERTLRTMAQQNQIALPPYPEIPADWKEELPVDSKELRGVLEQQAAQQTKDLLVFWGKMMIKDGGAHWMSDLAPFSIGLDTYIEPMAKGPAKPPGGQDMAPFIQEIAEGGMLDCAKVFREELIKYRNDAEKSGWREEEAKQRGTEYMGLLQAYWQIGRD